MNTLIAHCIVLVLSAAQAQGVIQEPSDQARDAGRIEQGKTLDLWITVLASSDPLSRVKAVTAIGKLGPGSVRAVHALVGALRDEDRQVRMATVSHLLGFGSEPEFSIDELMKPLLHDDYTVRFWAVCAMGLKGRSQASVFVPALAKMIGDSDRFVRIAAPRCSDAHFGFLRLRDVDDVAQGVGWVKKKEETMPLPSVTVIEGQELAFVRAKCRKVWTR